MGRKIIVDGANVAYAEKGERGEPKLANLLAVRRQLQDLGYDPIIVVDASLRHTIDDAEQYETLEDEGVIKQAPSGTEADYFVVRLAEDFEARIVSNDQFEPYLDRFPGIAERRVPLMIVDGVVVFHRLGPVED
ncbi:MAG: hypothetical protein KY456_04120 [Chloroflexi bacterium]|nr:hypothetical protein [Chloroflexota bacterium]